MLLTFLVRYSDLDLILIKITPPISRDLPLNIPKMQQIDEPEDKEITKKKKQNNITNVNMKNNINNVK